MDLTGPQAKLSVGQELLTISHQNESERGAVNRSGETSVMSLGSPRQTGGGVWSPSKWHHLVLVESGALALTWSLTLEGRSNTAVLHCGSH